MYKTLHKRRKANTKTPFEVLYDDVVIQLLHSQSRRPLERFHSWNKKGSLWFFWSDSWETYPQHFGHYFCLPV